MVEQVQRRAARFIFNNYSRLASVSEMLTDLNWATLTHSRKEQKVVMLYKIVHHLVDNPASKYLTPITTSNITRGHHKRFLQPSSTVNAYLHSFFPSIKYGVAYQIILLILLTLTNLNKSSLD